MNKENGIKRLNRLSVQAKEYRDENTQVVKLSQAIEVVELLDEPKPLTEDQAWKVIADVYNQDADLWKDAKNHYLNSLKEKEKPVIPQFVADYIERAKPRHDSLYQAMDERASDEIKEWVRGFYNSNTFARAWLNGYEVEETLYYMPLPYQSNNTIYYYKQDDGKISFKQGGMMKDHSKFTQEELDKYFPEIKHMAEEVRNE